MPIAFRSPKTAGAAPPAFPAFAAPWRSGSRFYKVPNREERYETGGGGINAARVIKELGGFALAI